MSDMTDELRDLIDEYLGGELDQARFARLQAWLTDDPRARSYFIRYAQIDFQLFVDMRADRAADRVMDQIRDLTGGPTEDSVGADVAALQAEARSPVAGSKSSVPASDSRPQPSGKSSVLGFLGDVSRRSWSFFANHALVVSGLATLAAAVVVAVIVLQNRGVDHSARGVESRR